MNKAKVGSLLGGGAAVAAALAFWLVPRVAERSADSYGGGTARTAPVAATFSTERPLAGAPAVVEAQLPEFVAAIEALVNGAAERIVAQGSGNDDPAAAPLRAVPGRRVPNGEPLEREFDVTAAGETGSVRALGLAFTRPWPARYDMAMQLTQFSQARTLTADGALHYNFIRTDREAAPSSYGLFRARLTLAGAFTGDVDLHGEIDAGRIVSLVVLTGDSRRRLSFGDRAPKPVVTYVTTIAGTGKEGNSDGPALEAELNEPAGVIVDREGRVFIADTGNHAIRELSPSGALTTLSTAFEDPWDLAFDGLGLLVVSDRASSTKADQGPISRVVTGGPLKGTVIRTIGKPANRVNGFPFCSSFSCDGRSPMAQMQWAAGIDVEGAVVNVAQWALPVGLRIVTPDGTVMTTHTWSQSGTVCHLAAPGGPYDLVRVKGVLYLTTDCHAVYRLKDDGTLEPFAGSPRTELGFADGVGADVKFSYPAGLVSDGEYLYLTESTGARLRRIDLATGETLRIAGCLAHTEGFPCNSSSGFADGPGDAALFDKPQNLALDPWGDLYVADTANHAIRFVRLANDPDRRPTLASVQPLSLQRGSEATLTIRGRDLGLASGADFGDGIAAEVVERSAKKLEVRVRIADDAAAGAHAFSVATPFGAAASPDGIALNVIDERAARGRVRTIAGTGAWSLGVNDIVPAEQAQFAFPGGIAAIDRERLLVADPLEQRVRLITTKDGAARELVEIAAYQAGGQTGLAILQGIEGLEGLAGNVLGVFGIDNFTEAPREALLAAVSRGLDEICRAARSDCEYMALPWAGIAGGMGNSGGFRLGARFAFPTDVAVAGDQKFIIADTGNSRIKTVGIDFSGTEPKDAPYIVAAADDLRTYPLAAVATAGDTVVAATSANATLAKVTLRDGSSVLSDFAGVEDAFRCTRADGDVRHPLGVPMGMASGKAGTFIADPYCATIWRLDDNGEVEDIRGELKLPLTPLPKCSDGPLVFATFSTPMDVAVDSAGNLWVADSGCNSIRVIKPLGADDVRAALDRWAGGITGWFDSAAAQKVAALAGSATLGDYDAARMWVTTVAGAADGEAGFRDGAASESLFNAPVSIAIAEEDGNTYVFVSDVGNKRIRLIEMNATVEPTARTPPPSDGAAPPLGGPGRGTEPLSPLEAVNYLLALPWQGLSAQYEADAAAPMAELDGDYVARGSGSVEGLAWAFSLRLDTPAPDVELGSPPGFANASRDGFTMAMPLQGTWHGGYRARLVGNATVNAGDLRVFSWTPEVLDIGLAVRDLRVTATANLDGSRAVPELETAAVNVQAHIEGSGALPLSQPVSLTASPRDEALELRGNLVNHRLELGGGVRAELDGDLVLTFSPAADRIVVDPAASVRDATRSTVPFPDDPLIDVTLPQQRLRVSLDGRLTVELGPAGEVEVPFAMGFELNVPSSDEIDKALRALERPIPRRWGEQGPIPAELAISAASARSNAELAQAAAEVEAALRAYHAPNGVVLSLLRDDVPAEAWQLGALEEPPERTWAGDEDAAIWTGHYLAAAAYRYAAQPNADALAGVELALGGLEALFDVTDGAIAVKGAVRAPVRSRGLLSRTLMRYPAEVDFDPPLNERDCYYVKGDGRSDTPALAAAQRGAVYGWGCSDDHPVSRDQYIGAMLGLSAAHRLVENAEVKARTARLIELALDFLIANGWNMPLPPEERIQGSSTFLGNFEKQLAMLRMGKTVNPDKYGPLYDYVAQGSALAWIPAWFSTIDPAEDQYYKFNLLHAGLIAALMQEQDAALRANYIAIMDMLWSTIGHHRNAYFDLAHVLARDPAARAAELGAPARFDPRLTLREEIGAVLGEWLARRELVRSPNGLLLNQVPDWQALRNLWPDEVGEYISAQGADRVFAIKALPVSLRLGRNMDFIWQRTPFEPGFVHDIDRSDTPTQREIYEAGQRGNHYRREGPGVDFLLAYWLAAYLGVVQP